MNTYELRSHKGNIKSVEAGSIADRLNIESGDFILSINDRPVIDIIDYMYLTDNEEFDLKIVKVTGEIINHHIAKDPYEPLGIVFENPILDHAKSCSNKCIFCFIDQNPSGLRPTLYFKDDDSRLSFLQGNFVTLTNLKEKDIDRIIEYRISPINVSVHTTNPELRIKMLNNRFAGNILPILQKLTASGILVNTQIVLCPDYNDKDELISTINDLVKLYPNLQSVAIVPLGVTKYRKEKLKLLDKDLALRTISDVHHLQEHFLEKIGTRFAFLADEFYLKAETPVPAEDYYEGYLQHEDGIGMIRKLSSEVEEILSLRRKPKGLAQNLEYKNVIITSVAAFDTIKKLSDLVSSYFGVKNKVICIHNEFFGETITVSGLITGRDIINRIHKVYSEENLDIDELKTKRMLLPINMFRYGENTFLDDLTTDHISEEFGCEVVIVNEGGQAFVEAISR